MLIALTGCAGGGSDSTSERKFDVRADIKMKTAAKLTKAEFLSRIGRACRNDWPTILANFVQVGENPPFRHRNTHPYAIAVRLSFTAGLDFYVFDAIYNLGAPAGNEETLEDLLGTMQEPLERTQQGLAPIRTPAQLEAHFAEYNRLARLYGLDDCLVAGAHVPPSFDPLPDG